MFQKLYVLARLEMREKQIFLLFSTIYCFLTFWFIGCTFEYDCRPGMLDLLVLVGCSEPRHLMLGPHSFKSTKKGHAECMISAWEKLGLRMVLLTLDSAGLESAWWRRCWNWSMSILACCTSL